VLAPGCDSQSGGIEIAFSDDGAPAWAEGTSEAAVIVSAAEASMRAYSPTLTVAQAQGCITSTLSRGSLDVAAAFDACGLGQIVSEGMAAYQAANNTSPATPSSGGPPAATLTQTSKPAASKPKITRITFKKHRLTITVAGIPDGLRLQLAVQAMGRAGHLFTLAQITTTHKTTTLRVSAWDRIVARFLEGHTQLPAVAVSRVAHGEHAGVRRQGVR